MCDEHDFRTFLQHRGLLEVGEGGHCGPAILAVVLLVLAERRVHCRAQELIWLNIQTQNFDGERGIFNVGFALLSA